MNNSNGLNLEFIRKRMKKKKMTLKELGSKIGYSESMVCYILEGKRNLPPGAMSYLCDALECTPNDLYGVGEKRGNNHENV